MKRSYLRAFQLCVFETALKWINIDGIIASDPNSAWFFERNGIYNCLKITGVAFTIRYNYKG